MESIQALQTWIQALEGGTRKPKETNYQMARIAGTDILESMT